MLDVTFFNFLLFNDKFCTLYGNLAYQCYLDLLQYNFRNNSRCSFKKKKRTEQLKKINIKLIRIIS